MMSDWMPCAGSWMPGIAACTLGARRLMEINGIATLARSLVRLGMIAP